MTEQLSLIQLNNCTLTETAAVFSEGIDFKDWLSAGRRLCKVSACVNWWIGDWINYGERAYGEKYKAAMEVTEKEYGTLANIASTCRNVGFSLRNEKLTWRHWVEIAKIKGGDREKLKWVNLTVENEWDPSDLRVALRKDGQEVEDDGGKSPPAPLASLSQGILTWWRRRVNESPIDSWASEQRASAKKHLQPIVDIYNQL